MSEREQDIADEFFDFQGVTPGFSFSKWYDCIVCGESFREQETVLYKGKRYGIPCGCSLDITKLASRGK